MPKPVKPELTELLIASLCSKMQITGSLTTALLTCGLTRATYDEWAREAARGKGDPLSGRLVAAVASAEGEIKLVREHQLSQVFDKDWRALAWWLERRYPEEYGQKAKEPKPSGREDHDDIEALIRGE
jgi:hypothetical protein